MHQWKVSGSITYFIHFLTIAHNLRAIDAYSRTYGLLRASKLKVALRRISTHSLTFELAKQLRYIVKQWCQWHFGPSALESTVDIEVAFVEVYFQPRMKPNQNIPVEIEIMKKISACIVAREDKTVAKHQFHPYLCSCWNEVKFVLSLWDFQFQYLGRLIFK